MIEKADRLWKALLVGFGIFLVVELLQLVSRVGMFDLDDLMRNVFGTLLGWACYRKWIREC